jgi:hypothetical protein
MRNEYKNFVDKPDHSEDLGVDGRKIFELIVGKQAGRL